MDHFDHSKCNLFSSFQAYNPNTMQGFLFGHFSIQTEQKHGPLGGWIITCSCTDKRANTKCLCSSECFRSTQVSLKQLLSSPLSGFSLKAVSASFLGHSCICLMHVTQARLNSGRRSVLQPGICSQRDVRLLSSRSSFWLKCFQIKLWVKSWCVVWGYGLLVSSFWIGNTEYICT